LPDIGPDKDSIENKMPFILYFLAVAYILVFKPEFTFFNWGCHMELFPKDQRKRIHSLSRGNKKP
jgi:hypothetical protein